MGIFPGSAFLNTVISLLSECPGAASYGRVFHPSSETGEEISSYGLFSSSEGLCGLRVAFRCMIISSTGQNGF